MMFFSSSNQHGKQERQQAEQQELIRLRMELDAIRANTAFISFDPKGNILNANALFLNVTGYRLDEVVGKHHRIFCTSEFANSSEYQRFWSDLGSGKSRSGTFHRLNKSGDSVYLEATYFPVKDNMGSVVEVIKICSDVTENHEDSRSKGAILEALD